MSTEHQISGSFTTVINLDRLADLVACRVADRVMGWLNTARPMPDQPQPEAAAVDPEPQPDQPQPEAAAVDPAQLPEGWTQQQINAYASGCTPACGEGHTYAGLCQAAMPIYATGCTPACGEGHTYAGLCQAAMPIDPREIPGQPAVDAAGPPFRGTLRAAMGPTPTTGTPVYDRAAAQIPAPRYADDAEHETEGRPLTPPRQPGGYVDTRPEPGDDDPRGWQG